MDEEAKEKINDESIAHKRPIRHRVSRTNAASLNEQCVNSPYKYSLAACSGKVTGRWTKEEHSLFLKGKNFWWFYVAALKTHGRNWKRVEQEILTRTGSQIRSHAQKYFTQIELGENSIYGDSMSSIEEEGCQESEDEEDYSTLKRQKLEDPSGEFSKQTPSLPPQTLAIDTPPVETSTELKTVVDKRKRSVSVLVVKS